MTRSLSQDALCHQTPEKIDIRLADLNKPDQAKALTSLLDRYARHPMGGGKPLAEFTVHNLARTLAQRNDSTVILAYDDINAVGLCNCFDTFSTFACKPILNIHDVFVDKAYRGQGIAALMMQKAEQIAQNKGCCKVTLEVLTNNEAARASYRASGYAPYQLDAQFGQAEFWQKLIR